MLNDMLQEIYKKAEELEESDFLSADIDWQAVMDNFSKSLLEDDIRAMKLVCVCEGMIVNAEK